MITGSINTNGLAVQLILQRLTGTQLHIYDDEGLETFQTISNFHTLPGRPLDPPQTPVIRVLTPQGSILTPIVPSPDNQVRDAPCAQSNDYQHNSSSHHRPYLLPCLVDLLHVHSENGGCQTDGNEEECKDGHCPV